MIDSELEVLRAIDQQRLTLVVDIGHSRDGKTWLIVLDVMEANGRCVLATDIRLTTAFLLDAISPADHLADVISAGNGLTAWFGPTAVVSVLQPVIAAARARAERARREATA